MSFTRLENYPYYQEYADSIDNIIRNKTMSIDKDNIVIKGEDKSQFIPFLINRHYKGADLITKAIRIHYLNSNNQGDYSEPVNVEYDDDQIRFCWLVPQAACLFEGDLKVSIEIIGTNSKAEDYIWKSYIYYMSVEKSLETGEGIIEPGQEWYVAFTRQVDELNKRIVEITKDDVDNGAEIRDARVDDQGIVHTTINDRFTSDLQRMYNKKNYELLEMNKGAIYTIWVGTNAEYNNLTNEEKEKYGEYKITDDPETICGIQPDRIFELDIDNNLTSKVKTSTHADNCTIAQNSLHADNSSLADVSTKAIEIKHNLFFKVSGLMTLTTTATAVPDMIYTDVFAKLCIIEFKVVDTNYNKTWYYQAFVYIKNINNDEPNLILIPYQLQNTGSLNDPNEIIKIRYKQGLAGDSNFYLYLDENIQGLTISCKSIMALDTYAD